MNPSKKPVRDFHERPSIAPSSNSLAFLNKSMRNNQRDEFGHGEDESKNPDLTLNLSLSSGRSKRSDLDLLDCVYMGSSQTSRANNEGEPRVYSCNYCQRKFYSSQALGGHQNAHKQQRAMAKTGQINSGSGRGGADTTATTPFGHNSYINPYTNISSLPLHGSINRALGVQGHSMIHKPMVGYFGHSRGGGSGGVGFSSFYCKSGGGGWSSRNPPLDHQQPAGITRLAPENYHMNLPFRASTSGARADGFLKFSPEAYKGPSEYKWDSGPPLKSANEDSKNLDLSLKL